MTCHMIPSSAHLHEDEENMCMRYYFLRTMSSDSDLPCWAARLQRMHSDTMYFTLDLHTAHNFSWCDILSTFRHLVFLRTHSCVISFLAVHCVSKCVYRRILIFVILSLYFSRSRHLSYLQFRVLIAFGFVFKC